MQRLKNIWLLSCEPYVMEDEEEEIEDKEVSTLEVGELTVQHYTSIITSSLNDGREENQIGLT